MTTKNLIPRASGEGGIGITDVTWGYGYYDTGNFNKGLFVSGHNITQVIAETVTQGGLGGEWTKAVNGLDIYYNDGNVGIGTATPKLNPNPGKFLTVFGGSAGSGWVEVGTSSQTDNLGGAFTFNNTNIAGTDKRVAQISSLRRGADNVADLSFSVNNGNGTGSVMHIKSDGNVGIGTTNPATSLDINKGIGEASPIITLSRGGVSKSRFAIANATDSILDGALTDDLCIRTEGGNIRFGTASATKTDMSILSSGNVGIGTTTPNRKIHVHTDTAVTQQISCTSLIGGLALSHATMGHGTDLIGDLELSNAVGNLKVFLTAEGESYFNGGNVGIGTTNPSGKLDVQGSNANGDVRLSIGNTSAAQDALTLLLLGNDEYPAGSAGFRRYSSTHPKASVFDIANLEVGKHITFSTRSGVAEEERMRIDANGNVGIGTDSPGAELDVVGRVHFSKIPCSNNAVPASLFTGASMSFQPASSNFGTGKPKDIALSWASLHDAGGTGVGETDFLFGSINPSGNPQELMKLYSDGRVRIGRNSSENITGQQFYGALVPGGSLEIRAEQDTNAGTAQLRIVGGSGLNNLNGGQAVTGSLYIDNGGQASTVGKFKISQDIIGGEIHVVSANNGVKLTSGATSWVAASDETLKENIKPLENVLDKIKDYRCVEYNLKNSPEDKKIGFIAQDWVDDFNPIVNKDEEDVLGMKYTETIPVLLKAIQEQQQLIEDLKSRIETLENK
jgi:hypothetical protein